MGRRRILHRRGRQNREAEDHARCDDAERTPVAAVGKRLPGDGEDRARQDAGRNGAADADDIMVEAGQRIMGHRQGQPEDDHAGKTRGEPDPFGR